MIKRILFLLYGVVCYSIFFGTFLYACGFVGNVLVPKSIDGTPQVPFLSALLINAGLLSLFALQHSIMARPAFKNWWTKLVPEPLERSTYVLFSSLCLLLLVWQWQPMGGIIWEAKTVLVQNIHYALFACGWLLVLISTFMINHFDLFGLRQSWFFFLDKPYEPLKFRVPLFYKYVRHPLYLGWLFAFWFTPVMTVTHLVFALATTGYIFVAIQLEEKDLVSHFGEKYVSYKKAVPMIIPVGRSKEI